MSGTGAGSPTIYRAISHAPCSIEAKCSTQEALEQVGFGFDLGLGNVRVDETQHASSTRLEVQPISSALDGSPNPLSFRADFHCPYTL